MPDNASPANFPNNPELQKSTTPQATTTAKTDDNPMVRLQGMPYGTTATGEPRFLLCAKLTGGGGKYAVPRSKFSEGLMAIRYLPRLLPGGGLELYPDPELELTEDQVANLDKDTVAATLDHSQGEEVLITFPDWTIVGLPALDSGISNLATNAEADQHSG